MRTNHWIWEPLSDRAATRSSCGSHIVQQKYREGHQSPAEPDALPSGILLMRWIAWLENLQNTSEKNTWFLRKKLDNTSENSEKKASVASPKAATFYFYKSFWSVLQSQALKTLLNLLETDLALHQRFPKPSLGPSLQPSPDPVKLDLALHQGFLRTSPEPSPEPCGTLLNLTWLCTTFSRTLLNLTCLRNKPPRPSPEPSPSPEPF